LQQDASSHWHYGGKKELAFPIKLSLMFGGEQFASEGKRVHDALLALRPILRWRKFMRLRKIV
jgi:hypothetical protein